MKTRVLTIVAVLAMAVTTASAQGFRSFRPFGFPHIHHMFQFEAPVTNNPDVLEIVKGLDAETAVEFTTEYQKYLNELEGIYGSQKLNDERKDVRVNDAKEEFYVRFSQLIDPAQATVAVEVPTEYIDGRISR